MYDPFLYGVVLLLVLFFHFFLLLSDKRSMDIIKSLTVNDKNTKTLLVGWVLKKDRIILYFSKYDEYNGSTIDLSSVVKFEILLFDTFINLTDSKGVSITSDFLLDPKNGFYVLTMDRLKDLFDYQEQNIAKSWMFNRYGVMTFTNTTDKSNITLSINMSGTYELSIEKISENILSHSIYYDINNYNNSIEKLSNNAN